jgi:hypothetical protein
MIVAKTDSVETVEVKLYKGAKESIQAVNYNEVNNWSIYFDEIGFYDLRIEALD